MVKSKLEILTEKRNQINARIQSLRSKDQTQLRKEENRRKIIVGSVILKMVKSGAMPKEKLDKILDEYLTTERDRNLFNLPLKNESQLGASHGESLP